GAIITTSSIFGSVFTSGRWAFTAAVSGPVFRSVITVVSASAGIEVTRAEIVVGVSAIAGSTFVWLVFLVLVLIFLFLFLIFLFLLLVVVLVLALGLCFRKLVEEV